MKIKGKKVKKIGIMGTHGTGKTTLALNLASNIKSHWPELTVNLLPEVARNAPGALNEKSTIENQCWIHYTQFCSELTMSAQSDIVICDRTVLDSLAYSLVLGYAAFTKKHLGNAIEWLQTYDLLYFRRPMCSQPVIDDGVRGTDLTFRDQVDNVLKSWIDFYDIKHR